MAKTIRDEDLRLNIIINGDNGRKQMGELERAIHDTNSKLETLYQKRKKLEDQGKQDTQAYRNLSAQIGKHTKAIDGYREKLAALHRQQSINTMTLSELTSHINRVRAQLSKVDPGTPLWKQLNAELKNSSARLAELRAQAKVTGGTICTMAERVNRYIGLITAGFATLTGVFSGISRAKAMFQEWDEAIADAMKTTQLSREEILELDKDLKKLDTRTSQNDLLGLARTAGKLGIEGRDNILQFVSAADKINIALSEDLGDNAEEALREIGKLVDIFSLETDYGIEQAMLKVGSTINSLGMASTANEGYIVNFTKRIAGIAPNADISIDKVLGLAATLDKYGQMSETAATAVGQTITGMYKRTEEFARVARMSFGDFKKLLEEDANEAFLRVLEGMNRGGEGMTTVVQALDSLHLNGQRASTVLGSLAKHSDELRNQQLLANQAFVDGTSVIEEANIKNTTATAIMEKRKKDFVDMAVTLGKELTPAINVSLSASTWLLKGLSALVTVCIKYRSILLALTAAYATNIALTKLKVVWQKLEVFWSAANRAALAAETASLAGATSGTMLLCAAKNLLVLNLKAATVAFKAFWASIGPIGWISLAIGALVGTITAFRDRAKDASQAMEKVATAQTQVNRAVADGDFAEKVTLVKKLAKEWRALGADLQKQQQFIKENATAFDDLGIEITDVNTADALFINRTPEFIKALELRAKSEAAYSLAQEVYRKKLELERAPYQNEPMVTSIVTGVVTPPENAVNLTDPWRKGWQMGDKFAYTNPAWKAEVDERDKQLAQLDKQWNEYLQIHEAEKLAYADKLKGMGLNPNPNPNQTPGDDTTAWSLNTDEKFLKQRLTLKKKYQTSETMTEEEFNAELLKLEIDTLRARLATNEDSGADRIALEEQLVNKLIQQKERQKKQEEKDAEDEARKQDKINQDIAEMSGDRIAIEKAKYEKLKREYAGNARALEALEKAHKARLAKIQLEAADKEIDARRDAYEVARMQMLNRHRQEMETFSGSERERREKRKEHWEELNKLDEKYLNEMIATLTTLVNDAKIGDIEIGVALSDEDKAKLLKQIADLREQLTDLTNTADSTAGKSGGGELWGLSQDQWKDMFSGNLEGWEDWSNNIATIVGSVGDQVISIWGKVNDLMAAQEKAQLKEYEKNNNKKKKDLEARLNAGRISEEQYKAEVEAMDAEYEAYQEELALKQAKRQKAMNLTQAIINTAVSVTQTLAQWGLPWGLIPAGIAAAMGAAEIALIAAQPITTGAEDGGPIGVRREQDGKPFQARLNPNKRGFVSSPTVLVAENGLEYVMPNEVMQNPTVYPLLSAMETARQNGTLDSLDFSAIYSPYSVRGRAVGGFVSDRAAAEFGGAIVHSSGTTELEEVLRLLYDRLQYPIQAKVAMLGSDGIIEQTDKYNKVKSKGNIGG